MTYKTRPDETTIALLAKLGGHVWNTTTAIAAGGTGTSRVSIETHRVPDAARQLLGWTPYMNTTTPAVAKSQNGFFDIIGTNYKFQPQQVLAPGASIGLSVGSCNTEGLQYWDAYIPVNGGETWDVGYTPLSANSANSKTAATFFWTDVRVPLPVIYSQVGSVTALSTSAAVTTAGGDLNINNARMLIEVGGQIAQNAAIIAGEEINITVTMTCTAWSPIQQTQFTLEPRGSPIATSGEAFEYNRRVYQKLEFTTDRATIKTTFLQNDAATNAPNAYQYIRWI